MKVEKANVSLKRTMSLASPTYKSYLRAMSCALVNMLPMPWRARHSSQCYLLGRAYDTITVEGHHRFLQDFCSHLLLTYRYDFDPLVSSELRPTTKTFLGSLFRHRRPDAHLQSDSGWGCMIRVFQMALAQVVRHLFFGRRWRRPHKRVTVAPFMSEQTEVKDGGLVAQLQHSLTSTVCDSIYPWCLLPILELFLDVPHAPLSIHRIVLAGRDMLGIDPGQWFGPTSCAQVLATLINGQDVSAKKAPKTDTSVYSDPPIRNHRDFDFSDPPHSCPALSNNQSDTPKPAFGQPLVLRAANGQHFTLAAVHSSNGEIPVQSMRELLGGNEIGRAMTETLSFSSESDCEIGGRGASWACGTETAEEESIQNLSGLVLFISLRLGLDSFNLKYQSLVQSCFALPQFQGLAGGGPLTSAYWFIAATTECLFYLDPHIPVQPALRSIGPDAKLVVNRRRSTMRASSLDAERQSSSPISLPESSQSFSHHRSNTRVLPTVQVNGKRVRLRDFEKSFFPSQPKQLSWRALNPSMTLLFLLQSQNDLSEVISKLKGADVEGVLSFEDVKHPLRNREGIADDGYFLL